MECNTKIDGYKPEERVSEEGGYDLKVIFMAHHEVFAEKEYKGLEFFKVKKVKDILFNCTEHNLNETEMSRIIPFLTILHEIEECIYKN